MFLEKYSRFVRRYSFLLRSRKSLGVPLPLRAEPGLPSLEDALRKKLETDEAAETQPNRDLVTLVKMEPGDSGSLTLLFHRDRPSAADPTYRRFDGGRRILRNGQKAPDEEQSVSAHLIILPDSVINNRYLCALEEIPGLSASTVVSVLRRCLNDYQYDYYDKSGEVQQTYTTLKYEGIKAASFTEALKKGILDIRLSRPAKVTFLDGEGLVEPGREVATIKMRAHLEPEAMIERLMFWRDKAAENGWTDFSVDLELDHHRRKTVKLEREAEAKEILFVSSDMLEFKTALSSCAAEPVPEFVAKAIKLLKT